MISCTVNMFDAQQEIYYIHHDGDKELISICDTDLIGNTITNFISATSLPVTVVYFIGNQTFCQKYIEQIHFAHPNLTIKVINR